MIDYLLAVLFLTAAAQATPERRFVGLLFSGLAVLHGFIGGYLEGFAYFGSAALFDFSVILFSARLRVISRMIEGLQDVCLASIVLNAAGWVMWMLYLPMDAYNGAFVLLYAWAILIMFKKDARNATGGAFQMGNGDDRIRAVPGSVHPHNKQREA